MKRSRQPELIAGLDEVGMGCWAGPMFIVVAAFSDKRCPVDGVADSKKLSSKKREELAPLIVGAADYIGVGWSSAKVIDSHGLASAWQLAAAQALEEAPPFRRLYVDGTRKVAPFGGAQSIHTKGESKFWQIAAASVVAKVLRDREMEYLAEFCPAYGFEKHAGYGTSEHRKQLLLSGPCLMHRMSFLRKLIAKEKPLWAQNGPPFQR